MHRYLIHLLLAIFTLILSVGMINWLADPYGVFGAPIIHGINAAKPEIASHARIYKIVGFAHHKMEALILGTSRADHGLNPKHKAFQNMPAQNLALGGQPNAESSAIFKFVSDHSELNTAVIGLDFFVSNSLYHYPEDFSLDNFSDNRDVKLLFSISTFYSSLRTLFHSGQFNQEPPDMARINPTTRFDKQQFIKSEKAYIEHYYLPQPQCEYTLDGNKLINGRLQKYSPLDDIRSMIALAYKRHIKLHLFISPSHARQWETLAALGLWDKWEEWKRHLVNINEDEARRAGQQPFILWDFSGYNSITTESFPATNISHATMYGYTDTSHYKPIIGDLILDRLFELKMDEHAVPDDFGVEISSLTIDSHLANIRKARKLYQKTHPEDVAEIKTLARNVTNTMVCQTPIITN